MNEVCRYDDCINQNPIAEEDQQVTCQKCRDYMGLPSLTNLYVGDRIIFTDVNGEEWPGKITSVTILNPKALVKLDVGGTFDVNKGQGWRRA